MPTRRNMTNEKVIQIDKELAVLQDRFNSFDKKLEEHCRNNEKGFDEVSRRIEGTNTLITELDNSLAAQFKEFWKEADKRYAGKIVERVVYTAIGIVCTVILYALLKKLGLDW